MAQPTRQEALATLAEGHERLRVLFAALPDEAVSRPATIGAGDWSAKDLAGHIESWEGYALRTVDEWLRGEEPWIERAAFSGPADGVDRLNEETYRRTTAMPASEVMAEFDATHERLVRTISDLGDERWVEEASYETPGGRRARLGILLGSIMGAPQRPFGHAFAHLPDLEAFVESLA